MKCIDSDRVIADGIRDSGEAKAITMDRDELWNALYEARDALIAVSYQYSNPTQKELQGYAELLADLRTLIVSRYSTVVMNLK